jgi:hypothetical protein
LADIAVDEIESIRRLNMDLIYIGLGVVFLVLSVALVSGFEKLRSPK